MYICIHRFASSFSLRLDEHRESIDTVVRLLAEGGPALEARRRRCVCVCARARVCARACVRTCTCVRVCLRVRMSAR